MNRSIIIFFLLLVFATVANAANYTLEIMNIKPAGTGTPAIDANNRIFRAYTGIEYNIRAAVMGGDYPYTFGLSNAPAGMVIDGDTGEITWPNPQANANNIQITVTDSSASTDVDTWSITVGTTGFIFVDPNYSGTETGSIAQPYNTLTEMLDNGSESDIVYFRAGTSTIPAYHGAYVTARGCNLDYSGGRPRIWIGYPGEDVVIDSAMHNVEYGESATDPYFDDFKLIGVVNYGFTPTGTPHYQTYRRCEFTGAYQDRGTYNGNQGFVFLRGADGAYSYYTVFQDLKIHDYTGMAGIGSLYDAHKALIEDCTIYDQALDPINLSCGMGIAAKVSFAYSTVRHNDITVTDGPVFGGSRNGTFSQGTGRDTKSGNLEICFNRFRTTDSGQQSMQMNSYSNMEETYIYRNTIHDAGMGFKYLNICGVTGVCETYPADNGPFYIYDNVIVNDDSDYLFYNSGADPESNIGSDTGNLKGLNTASIVDSDGLLLGSYRDTYLGVAGWETADVTTLTLQADFTTSSAATSFTFTGTSAEGTTVASVVSNNGTATITSGAGTDSVSGTVTGVSLTSGANAVQVTLTDSVAGTDIKTINITYTPAVPTYTAKVKRCTLKNVTLK